MARVSQKYRPNITEVFKIITMLPEQEKNKIPEKVLGFFEYNSIPSMMDKIEMNSEIIKNNLSLTTRRFLKIVEIYLSK